MDLFERRIVGGVTLPYILVNRYISFLRLLFTYMVGMRNDII